MNKMKLLCILCVFSLPSMAGDDGKIILKKAMDQLLTMNVEMSMEITETDTKGRVKEKGYDILMAKFGDVEKTRMIMQKPDRAKGITIVLTNLPDEVGIIEVYTPANGKTRKMKATPQNMSRVGSNFSLSNFASADYDAISCKLLGKKQIDSLSCYQLEVKEQSDSIIFKAEFMVEENTFHIVQIISYDEDGKQANITKLSDFQPINGTKNKIQPMLIMAEDIAGNKHTRIQVLNIFPRTDLKEEDFSIQGVGE
ncbi:MAG: outer membrane lipoprotein-sorting protein [Bacteroidales bacterium]|nr:outer membrane lipoprotein-sorting protein [Bacteroidales bacterium]